MDDLEEELKKFVAACLATDPMLNRLAAAGDLPECAELAERNFDRLLDTVDANPPGPWAVVSTEGACWAASVHEYLEDALEEYDPNENFLCRAKIEGGKVSLALDGKFVPFEATLLGDDFVP